VVVSRDKGFDPLIAQLLSDGLNCRRADSMRHLAGHPTELTQADSAAEATSLRCAACGGYDSIPHLGGAWCPRRARFSSPPDRSLLPSAQPASREPERDEDFWRSHSLAARSLPECGWCHRPADMAGGVYDDGEWMCGECVSAVAGG
jgi:hypothetical protein